MARQAPINMLFPLLPENTALLTKFLLLNVFHLYVSTVCLVPRNDIVTGVHFQLRIIVKF